MKLSSDPYQVLDLDLDATYADAKSAYRRLAEIFHPDRFTDSRVEIQAEAEKQMKRLNVAWAALRVRLASSAEEAEDDDDDPSTRRFRAGPGGAAERAATAEWADNDFSNRARHARTREQARTRRAGDGPEGTEREEVSSAPHERDEWLRTARQRLENEARQRLEEEAREQQARS